MKEKTPQNTKLRDQCAISWRRQSRATCFFKKLMLPWTRWKLNYRFDKIGLKGEPYIVLANHNTDFDPILVNLAADGPVRFVASEHIMRKGLGTWFLKTFFQPIIFQKGALGAGTTLEMFRALKRGEPVVLFPEGNRSFNGRTGYIPEVTGKLVKKSGAALVTYRLEGGYLTQPRWGTSVRKGSLTGRKIGVYPAADLKSMTAGEVTELIRRDLAESAYETQKRQMIPYKGKRPALGMESALFVCPCCKGWNTLTSTSDAIACSCGWHATMDPYGFLEEDGDQPKTGIRSFEELDELQRKALREAWSDPDGGACVLFEDPVTAMKIGEDHQVLETRTGRLAAYADHYEFDGFTIPHSQIHGAAVHSRNGLTVHYGDGHEHYEIMGTPYWNALKYIYLYHLNEEREMF